MEQIEIVEIVVQAKPGANQEKAIKECLELATSRWQNVSMRFNGRTYRVAINDLLAVVK